MDASASSIYGYGHLGKHYLLMTVIKPPWADNQSVEYLCQDINAIHSAGNQHPLPRLRIFNKVSAETIGISTNVTGIAKVSFTSAIVLLFFDFKFRAKFCPHWLQETQCGWKGISVLVSKFRSKACLVAGVHVFFDFKFKCFHIGCKRSSVETH